MEVSRIRALRGPNLWSRQTSIEAIVSCEPQEREMMPGNEFEKQLRRIFPAVGPLEGSRPGQPASMAHALEKITLSLQNQAGCPITFSRTTATEEEGVYQVVVQYTEEDVGRLALAWAEKLCLAVKTQTAFDLNQALTELRDLDEDVRLGPSTGSIVDAAVLKGIPYRRLTEGSMVQFGWGSKQRRIQAAETDTTSAIAESIAQDKDLTKSLLLAAGVPVPIGRPAKNLEDAWQIALSIGLPIVVKPQDGNQGKGVTVNIVERELFNQAYKTAARYGEVLVEKFLPGSDYRLLVVGNKLVAAARREPPLVVGDGIHTVKELVDKVNADPRRGDGHSTSLTKIKFDVIAIARLKLQDMEPSSVPEKVVVSFCATTPTCPPAAQPPMSQTMFTQKWLRASWSQPKWWALTFVVWMSFANRFSSPSKNKMVALWKSMRRLACACTSVLHLAKAETLARPSLTTCTPTGTTAVFLSLQSPAPMAKQPPCD